MHDICINKKNDSNMDREYHEIISKRWEKNTKRVLPV